MPAVRMHTANGVESGNRVSAECPIPKMYDAGLTGVIPDHAMRLNTMVVAVIIRSGKRRHAAKNAAQSYREKNSFHWLLPPLAIEQGYESDGGKRAFVHEMYGEHFTIRRVRVVIQKIRLDNRADIWYIL